MKYPSFRFVVLSAIAALSVNPTPALAWGDEGHEVVALVAQSFLD